MTLSFARLVPKLEFEFLPTAELAVALRRTTAEPKIAVIEQMLEPPLRSRFVLPAQAAAELACGALPKPKTTT